ncbi:ROK family transcriptional regulator [Plantibacter sp. ME-Dv--P-122b]|jgi:predicted NBD/HSP70 family sugar kinase|uniref:ROK family transcriptional regulator n=1 Tax=Plantibacter sp. ME-Dv--P-122b TaxID=3040300 RepID=UPI002550C65C|nr:ROK family transcriptional regulator [Plantibacter sp. ME-Dv--P-122b]
MGGPQRVNPDEVLGLILQQAPISRSDLAREAGLSRAAVTLLVQDLIGLGIVEDNIPTFSAGGRRATGIRLDLAEYFMVAVRINRYELTFRIFDGSGIEVETTEVPIASDIKIEPLLALIEQTLRGILERRDERCFLGVAISSLGWLFETDGEVILHTDGFSELGKRDIRASVQAMFPEVPVLLEHDAKTSALAEYQDHVRETGRKPACLLNIVGGIGFGGGIIIDGKIFRGARGVAGEVGHLGINFNSGIHTRNVDTHEFNGLFEDYASPRALRQHVTSRLLDFPESSLTEQSTPEEIFAAFEVDDPLAVWAVERVCQLLAYGLAGLTFVLDPDVIVVGDAFPASETILERIRGCLATYLPAVRMEHLELKFSQRGTSGVLYGSYLLLIQWYLTNGELFARIQQSQAASAS